MLHFISVLPKVLAEYENAQMVISTKIFPEAFCFTRQILLKLWFCYGNCSL